MTSRAAASPDAAHAPVLKELGPEGGALRVVAMLARAEALAAAAPPLGLPGAGCAAEGGDAEVAVVAGACDGGITVDRDALVDVALGIGVGVLTGTGVGELGSGQTPPGDGGTEEALWLSYRKPSASPSRNVCDEMPRLEVSQDPPARLTNIAQ
jgi:hypothetical protein